MKNFQEFLKMLFPQQKIGINNMEAYVPPYFVYQDKFDEYRERPSLKTSKGLGQKHMAVPCSCEDSVTMAFNASKKILDQDNISKKDIGLVIVGTESGRDFSKSISSDLHGLLDLPSDVQNFDVKSACLAGAIALEQAFNWIKSGQNKRKGQNNGKSALVVCSDIAKYEPGSPAEPTQGAGAVAMIISKHTSKNPNIITLDKHVGTYSENVWDFWHPLNFLYAEVDGNYSIKCYSDAIMEAYRDYKEQGGKTDFDRLVFHTPFTKLPRRIGAEIIKTIRQEKNLEEFSKGEIEKHVEEMVGPSLKYSELVGNIYTGSGFLALLSLIESGNCKGKKVGMGFYGSGCSSMFLSGIINIDNYNSGFKKDLENRSELDLEKYDKVVYKGEKLYLPEQKGCVLENTDNRGRRSYKILNEN